MILSISKIPRETLFKVVDKLVVLLLRLSAFKLMLIVVFLICSGKLSLLVISEERLFKELLLFLNK
ncbi:hypothetical protein [Mycoplasma feriruminatoris]|uniref:hypothetical protein n=1 Tax=Mycoplasma feriruminatoris TaxID=1179777 RepID=UPI002420147F|nr:hypothetical protein [Mycoplasma feriruminatoris]